MPKFIILEYEEQEGGTGYREHSRQTVTAKDAESALRGALTPEQAGWQIVVRDEDWAYAEHPDATETWTKCVEAERDYDLPEAS